MRLDCKCDLIKVKCGRSASRTTTAATCSCDFPNTQWPSLRLEAGERVQSIAHAHHHRITWSCEPTCDCVGLGCWGRSPEQQPRPFSVASIRLNTQNSSIVGLA